jgi:uncharacterized membrane protein
MPASQKLKDYFVGGAIAILPLAVTAFVVWWVYNRFYEFAYPIGVKLGLSNYYASIPYSFVGKTLDALDELLMLILILLLIGAIVSRKSGKKFLSVFDNFVSKIPLVRFIYVAVRQGTDTLLTKKQAFKRVCIVEYPRKGLFAIGFVTNEGFSEVEDRTREDMYTVFVPTSPIPATGYVTILPKRDVQILDMSIEDGLKIIVSGGFLKPDDTTQVHAQKEIFERVQQKLGERVKKGRTNDAEDEDDIKRKERAGKQKWGWKKE